FQLEPEKGVFPDGAAPLRAGSVSSAWNRLCRVISVRAEVLITTMPPLFRPRLIVRAKDICANTTATAMPRPIETANCMTTNKLRKRPEPDCPAALVRSAQAGRKRDSTSAG